jgi:predicted transcriptional regulator
MAKFDWEAIEREYRAGQLSIREIAKQNGCAEGTIRKKAKKNGWERDLSEKINQKVRTELVRNGVRTLDPVTEKEIIEEAAATKIQIVRGHQKRIQNSLLLVDGLIEDIKEQRSDPDISVHSRISAVTQLSTAMKNFVALERQAFNIKDETEPEKTGVVLLPTDAKL